MNESQINNANISPVLIQLFKGVLYQERHPLIWKDLLTLKGGVSDYFQVIGLEVVIDESEGYAFLRQIETEEAEKDGMEVLPRLIPRRPLSYPLSLLCVLLRKKMAEMDASGGETRLILNQEQIIEMMLVFMPAQKNEARTVDRIRTTIKKAMELGFLRKLETEASSYEVRRIIKALVNADFLKNMEERLKEYHAYANKDN